MSPRASDGRGVMSPRPADGYRVVSTPPTATES